MISAPTPDGTLLAVAVRDGVAELSQAKVLRGTARRLVEEIGIEASAEEIARWLAQHGATTPGQAEDDAWRFVTELRGQGLVAAPSPAHDGRAAAWVVNGVQGESVDWSVLVRAVLMRGHRLRFHALGRSMRPVIPHGSLVEVAPRRFDAVRCGEVVLYSTGQEPLVAHRVVGARGETLLARGDSNTRLDVVKPEDFFGVVTARERRGRWRRVSAGPARWCGLATGVCYRMLVALAHRLVVRPLRATYAHTHRTFARAAPYAVLRLLSAGLRRLELLVVRAQRPLDTMRAALLSTEEKDEDRRALYAQKAIQSFTSLEENLHAGLTLLEEVLLAHHPIAAGKALVLGCGPGRECLALARGGFEVTGLDRDDGMLARARVLAREAGLSVRYVAAEVTDFEVDGGPFDVVVIFSGLYNMVLPRVRRVRMLAACARHSGPGSRVLVTFLSAYVPPGEPPVPRAKRFLETLNPDHELGDIYLVNEAVHIFPQADDVAEEARLAGLETLDLFRDQRAYDRASGHVRGFAVLCRPGGGER
jgi:2-polyprenyl-3-methyl-5-hydroxy-6-metoxy-1,4-benzoquinol methylase